MITESIFGTLCKNTVNESKKRGTYDCREQLLNLKFLQNFAA